MFSRRKKPSLLDIDNLLRVQLAPRIEEMARKRGFLRLLALGQGVSMAGFAAGVAVPAVTGNPHVHPVTMVLPAVFGLLTWWFLSRQKAFASEYKEKVMKPIAARFFPELRYSPDNFVSKSLYDDAGLFRESLDTYTGNDFFAGRLGEVDFQFSELLCQYTSGSGKNRQTHTVFRGFLFVGDFHRDFHFRTTVQPDLAESLLGVLGRGLQRMGQSVSDQKLVDLEDPEFESLFVVKSSDQVEARYILTPAFMEKLKNFRKKMNQALHLSFVNGKMFLFIPSSRDYFEPRIFGEILKRTDLMEFVDMLNLMIGVAEEFLHHPQIPNPPKMPHPPLPRVRP
jgi:hypothetical protein